MIIYLIVIKIDEKYSPFKIIDLEGDKRSGFLKALHLNKNYKINISGIIDRIDFKDDTFRIIDYKTGGDIKNIKSIESLFSNKKKDRNDAVFQLFFYSVLLKNKFKHSTRIIPGLMNIRDLNKC
ncbi:MAG: PD-(D/E)XK nuclease family protein [Cytophagales bacterium]